MIETRDRRAIEYLAAKSTDRPMLFYILKCVCVAALPNGKNWTTDRVDIKERFITEFGQRYG